MDLLTAGTTAGRQGVLWAVVSCTLPLRGKPLEGTVAGAGRKGCDPGRPPAGPDPSGGEMRRPCSTFHQGGALSTIFKEIG